MLLGPSQKPIIMPHYPHFLSADVEVWTRYLSAPVAPIKEVWYDVHVGRAMEVIKNATETEKRVAAGVSRKRIDVVARVGAGYWVIEVKPFAGMVALGQIISYTRLFQGEYVVDGQVWSVIVADAVDDDLLSAYDDFGVVVIVN